MKHILILLFLCACTVNTTAQIDEAAVAQKAQELGVDEEEVKRRLIAQGYDPDNIDPNDPAALLDMQQAAERIVAEIKAEQGQSGVSTTPAVDTTPLPPVPTKDVLMTQDNEPATQEPIKESTSNIYGHQLFDKGSIRFYKKSEYTNVPSDYILGPGDVVTVSIWGRSEANFSQEISDDGYVKFTQIPRISLSGLELQDAKALVRRKLSRNFPFDKEQFEFKVTATRNINVYMTGEVKNVGSYNMSAVNTAVNALAAAGGPSDIGSVRNIRISSSETEDRTLDLYEFLFDPSKTRDLYLFEGDYIIVPVINKVVNIIGAVNRPYRYEMLKNEKLDDLIEFAGGLRANALKRNIRITRYENDQKVIKNVSLLSANEVSNFELKNGDVVEIATIEDGLENFVAVNGAVDNPGNFAFSPGMKITDLLPKVVIKDNAILDVAYLTRLNDDQKTVNWRMININNAINNPSSDSNLTLKDGDQITLKSSSEFIDVNTIEVKGAVNSEGIYRLDGEDQLRITDAIFLSNGLRPGATDFGYIIRNTPGTTTPEYIQVDIKQLMDNPTSASNVALEPGDILQVYTTSQYVDDSYVSVEGAVRNPAKYKYDPSLTLSDVLRLSQGLTINAASNKVDIFRLEFNDNNKTRTLLANVSIDADFQVVGGDVKLQPFDQIIIRQAPEFEEQRPVFISGEVTYPGKYFILKDNFTIVDLIKEAGGTTAESFLGGATLQRSMDDVGYIVIDLEEAMQNPKSTTNVILQSNDIISIPKINNLVMVAGAVKKSEVFIDELSSQGNVNFVITKGKNAKYYIEKAGGFHENAEKSSVRVKYPNGEVKRSKRFLFWRTYPEVVEGSVVAVDYKPAEEIREKKEKEDIDWGKVLSNSIAQATAILSLLLLIQNVD